MTPIAKARKAIVRAMDGARAVRGKDEVALRSADWHAVTDTVSALVPPADGLEPPGCPIPGACACPGGEEELARRLGVARDEITRLRASLATLTEQSQAEYLRGFEDAREMAAKLAAQDYTPAYGQHRNDMECLAEIQRKNISEKIRAITPDETRGGEG